MSPCIRVIIVDDHPLILNGIKQLLSFYPDIHIVGEGCNGLEAIELVKTVPCDILLLDINMPVLSGIETVKQIKVFKPEQRIILLTVENNPSTLRDAIDLQVNGYILKGANETTLIDAIRHTYRGENFIDQSLTKHVFNIVQTSSSTPTVSSPCIPTIFKSLSFRELEILFYISEGFTNKEIGEKVFLAEKTIRNTITTIFRKLDVKDRVHATILALNHDIEKIIRELKSAGLT